MTKLLELAERCEKAEKGDRELDADIWEAFGLAPEYDNSKNNYGNWHRKEEGDYYYADDSHWGMRRPAPKYTTSLDASETLVPSAPFPEIRPGNWWWCVDSLGCSAHVAYENRDAGIPEYSAEASTPPLTLCAAALRAHHALINNAVD